MTKVGLRDANLHFSKYMKLVKEGEEVIVTDRGTPIAVIKPLVSEETSSEKRIKLLEERGVLRRAASGNPPLRKPLSINGRPLSEIVEEEREA